MKFIWNGACYERLVVRNFSDRPLDLRLTYRFAADFADLFEVRGEHRSARGEFRAALRTIIASCFDTRGWMQSSGDRNYVLSCTKQADDRKCSVRNIA